MPDLERALQIAVSAHAGQKDKNGASYIFHPIRVMMRCARPIAKIVALLHDVVDDTSVSFEQLQTEGLPGEVLEALRVLTHDPEVPYEQYIELIAANPLAIEVKLADLEDNSDIRRLDAIDEKTVARLRKYHQAYRRLIAAKPNG